VLQCVAVCCSVMAILRIWAMAMRENAREGKRSRWTHTRTSEGGEVWAAELRDLEDTIKNEFLVT